MTERFRLRLFLAEPFRLFFPLAALSGVLGVLLWPGHFWGWIPNYPGLSHTRIMAHGFFGGFIIGFLGTAWPRLTASGPFPTRAVAGWGVLFVMMVTAHALGRNPIGDGCFILLMGSFGFWMWQRLMDRQDWPPPGFLLVGMAIVFGLSGAIIALVELRWEIGYFWIVLKPLLYYQGFILLPVLGIGIFFLPKIFGFPSPHDFESTLHPTSRWKREAWIAVGVGVGLLGTFVLEAMGWFRSSHAIRCLIIFAYWFGQIPKVFQGKITDRWARQVRIALLFVVGSYAMIGILPEYRVASLHGVFIGGLGMIVLVVATRVLFGHSGNRQALSGRCRWLMVVAWLVWIALLSRISGDIWPKILVSHYNYAALLWAAALGVWGWYCLPKAFIPDQEE